MVFPKTRVTFVLIHVLPVIHLCVFIAIATTRAGTGLQWLFTVDAPISKLIIALAWRWGYPWLLLGTIGTGWWYFLSWFAWYVATQIKRAVR